jgi:hypothetical protein
LCLAASCLWLAVYDRAGFDPPRVGALIQGDVGLARRRDNAWDGRGVDARPF